MTDPLSGVYPCIDPHRRLLSSSCTSDLYKQTIGYTDRRQGRIHRMGEGTYIIYASAPLGGANGYMFYRCFFFVFFRRPPQR